MTILYFTATGNGLYIAKQIGGKLISIPKAMKENNFTFKDDKIGIVFPIYGWCVPHYIRDFLERAELNSDYIFAVMSYGMLAGGAADHLQKLAAENGICFSYIQTIKTVDNYLPGFDMKKQIETEAKKQIDMHLNFIKNDINKSRQYISKASFAARFMTKCLLKNDMFKTGVGVTEKYEVEDTCTKCGICANVCPTDNIHVENTKPVFEKKCISCLSCIHNCPQNAIHLSNEKSIVRFRNQHISVNEIMEANG